MDAGKARKRHWPQSRRLCSGALSATFDRGDIAHLSMRGHELVRLIYVAVRDPWWNTIPATPLSVDLHADAASFVANASARTTGNSLDLDWQLDVTGLPDGTLHVNFRARALRDCSFARIGLCLHFDAERFKRASWEAECDMVTRTGRFPEQIHPQYLVDGILRPCIPAFTSMRITLDSGAVLVIRIEGDRFEIEDQRNWTDATFKAYTTPLELGELHHLAAGDTIRQRLHVSLRAPAQPPPSQRPVIQARALTPLHQRLPKLGAALSPTENPSAHPPISLAHWRLDIRSAADVDTIAARMSAVAGPGKGIELVLHPDAIADHMLDRLLVNVLRVAPLTRLILLGEPENLPSPAQVLAMKAITSNIQDDLAVGAGAPDAYADLARNRNDFADVDFVSFPISSQTHVFDTRSIFETLSVQEQVVRNARLHTLDGQVVISSLTFGAQAHLLQENGSLPQADPRLKHVGAAWLGASLGRLALGGATSVTLAPDLWMTGGLPTTFTNLLRTFIDLDSAMLRPFDIEEPHRVFIFGATRGNETIVFLSNLTAHRQMIHLSGLSEGHVTELQEQTTKHDDSPHSAWTCTGSLTLLQPYQLRILRHVGA